MMDNFLSELSKTFPDEPGVKKYKTSYELVRKANPRKCVESYMAACTEYSQQIMNKDESFFVEQGETISFLKDMNIKKHWEDPNLSQGTREAIWQYIQTLYVLGTTITSFPPEALGMIEDVAQKCATNMQGGDGEDPTKMLSNMSGLFSSLGNMLQDGKKN
jgi:uncharacterized protein (UPF0147 family)